MEYCFIEHWQNNYKLPEGSKAVGLNPQACYQLGKCGIEYLLLEDFYSYGQICEDTDQYLDSQLLWFDRFDEYIQDIYPQAKQMDLRLPSLFFYNIKNLVDQVIFTIKIIEKFLKSNDVSKVYFLPQINGDDKFDQWYWFYFGKSCFYRLAGIICKKNGVNFEVLNFSEKKEIPPDYLKDFSIGIPRNFMECKDFIRNILPKPAWHYLKKVKERNLQRRCLGNERFPGGKGKILILKSRDYVYDFCKDAHKSGFELFFKGKNTIYSFSPFFKTVNLGSSKDNNVNITEGLSYEDTIDKVIQGELMEWINLRCGFDVSSIFRSRFQYLIKELFPKTIKRVREFVSFYDTNDIDFVVTPVLFSYEEFAAVAAARISKTAKSVGFCHGADAFQIKARFFMEYCHFDLYFSSIPEEVRHIEQLKRLYGYAKPLVHEYSYFRRRFDVNKKKREFKTSNKVDNKPKILFLPITRKKRSVLKFIKGMPFTMKCLRRHSAFIDYFSSRAEFDFIWKTPLYNPRFDRTVREILKDKSAQNISFNGGRLKELLSGVDKVICDGPSTGFFECIFSGVPVLTFYNPLDQNIHGNMQDILGESLQPCLAIEEEFRAIDEFLNSDPKRYVVLLSQTEVSVLDILADNLLKANRGK